MSSRSAAPPPTTVRGRARKAKGQGGERREEILEHAQRLFAAHGVHSVSTRQIAEAVGISQPTLYAYFPRKADIMEEVSARAFQKVGAAAARIRGEAGDPVETMVRAYIDFGLTHPDAYRIAFMIEGLEDPCLAPADDRAKVQAATRAFDGLRTVVADRLGHAHPDVEVAAQSLWAAMHGLVALLLARSGFPWVEHDRLIDWHVSSLLATLRETGQRLDPGLAPTP